VVVVSHRSVPLSLLRLAPCSIDNITK